MPKEDKPRKEYGESDRSVIHMAGFTVGGQRIDNLGRTQPTRLNWLHFIHAIPGMIGEGFKVHVPDEFLSLDVDEDGTEVAVVACPCGMEPRVPIARVTECDCGRFYMATDGKVLVANSPQARAPD